MLVSHLKYSQLINIRTSLRIHMHMQKLFMRSSNVWKNINNYIIYKYTIK